MMTFERNPLCLLPALILTLASFALQAQEPVASQRLADAPVAESAMEVVIVRGRLRDRAEILAGEGFDSESAAKHHAQSSRDRRGTGTGLHKLITASSQ